MAEPVPTLTKQQQIDMAREAESILSNPAFVRAVAQVNRTMYETWLATQAKEIEGRERLWAHTKTMESLIVCLRQAIGNGTLARDAIERAKGKPSA